MIMLLAWLFVSMRFIAAEVCHVVVGLRGKVKVLHDPLLLHLIFHMLLLSHRNIAPCVSLMEIQPNSCQIPLRDL